MEPAGWAGRAAALAGRSPADAVLGAASLADAERTTRVRPAGAPATAAPAPADEVPAAGPRAAPRLSALLHGRDRDLVEAVLRDLVSAGRRVPDECLPALLDVATRSVLPADLVGKVLGRRGRWLAGFRPEWAAAVAWLTEDPSEAALNAGPVDGGPLDGGPLDGGPLDASAWSLGTTAQRVQWLVRSRRRDPAAAREALAAGWAKEKLADRVMFTEALATGLHADDEAFLELALTDRSDRVRQAARTLLLALPGSGVQRQVARRAAECVRLVNGMLRRTRIVVTPPAVEGMRSEKDLHDLVRTLVAAAPLSTWVPLLGADPAEVVETPVEGGWHDAVHKGWLAAAQRERDPVWGFALLARADPADLDDALQLVPPEARYALVAERLRSGPVSRPGALLQACPAPWPDDLTAAVVGMAGLDHRDGRGLSNTLGRLAGIRARPGFVDAVHRVAEELAPDHSDQHHLATMATMLANRRRLIEEIE